MAEGQTDGEGRWSFPLPPAGRYRVMVDAGAGHRKWLELTVPAADARPRREPAGPSAAAERAEFTGVHWPRLGLGVMMIAAAALAAWGLLRGRQPRPGL